jgi:polyhydroxyalkanoate synthesis regulator phasin
MSRNKWALAVAAGAFTTALVGGVALAGLQLPALDTTAVTTVPAVADASTDQESRTKLKAILDGLVAKGTITQAQEDAIVQALAAAAPTPKPNLPNSKPRTTVPSVMSFIGDLTKAASTYLGMDTMTLLAQLRGGKSVADIANGLSAQGKSAQGLIDTLTKTANDKLDAAVGASKLTADQAATLKPKIAAEITTFVNRSFTKPVLPRPFAPAKPSPSPKS